MFLEKYEEELVKILSQTGAGNRNTYVWGCLGFGAVFIDILNRYFNGCQIIDKKVEDDKADIKKPQYLAGVNMEEASVLLCMKDTAEAESFLKELGAVENVHYFKMRELVYGGEKGRPLDFINWVEYRYGCDFIAGKDNRGGEGMEYVPSPFQTVKKIAAGLEIEGDAALFDYGMGKGTALLLFREYGIRSIGGVERDKELYDTVCGNFAKLGIKNAGLFYRDARDVKEIDSYDHFYFYNPFVGSIFQQVIHNIVDSYQRNRRKIRIIYVNTVCHDMIIESGIFRLEKQIEVGHWYPMANIYTTGQKT